MARHDYYTVEDKTTHWLIRKIDNNFEPSGQPYEVTKPSNTPGKEKLSHCSCFAGLQGKYCRHKQLIPIMEAAGAINTGRAFNFDKQKWLEPTQGTATPLVDLDNLEM